MGAKCCGTGYEEFDTHELGSSNAKLNLRNLYMKDLNLTNRIRKERRIRIFTTPGISFLRRISYGRKKYDLCGSISQRNVHRSLHKIEKSSSSDFKI